MAIPLTKRLGSNNFCPHEPQEAAWIYREHDFEMQRHPIVACLQQSANDQTSRSMLFPCRRSTVNHLPVDFFLLLLVAS
jgi:hypothetical protein